MTTATAPTRGSPVQRQLEAYERSVTGDHPDQRARRESEETFDAAISIFLLLQQQIDSWEEKVFRGTEEYSPDEYQFYQQQLRAWPVSTDTVLHNLGSSDCSVRVAEEADRLRACADRAWHLLASWTPPRLSAAVGLREMTLSPAAAAALQPLLDRAGSASTPPPRPLRKIETGDPSFLKTATP